MTDFLNQIFLDNSVLQWGILVGVVLLVVLLNPFLGRVIGKIVYQLFRRVAPERGERFTDLVLRPLEYLAVLTAIGTVLSFMKYPTALDFDLFNIHVHRILQMTMELLFIGAVSWLVLRMVDFVGEVLHHKASLTESTQDDQFILFIRDVLKVLVYIAIIFILFGSVFDMNINSLLAGAGLAGLAVALAAQDSLANLFGSLTIFSEKPFVMGDLVETNEILGTVEKVGFRSTRIRTLDKTFVTLPNRKVMENPINNLSERTFRRVQYNVGLLYGTPVETIRKIVGEIQAYLDSHEKTTEDGIASFYNYGPSSLDIQVIYFIKVIEYNMYLRMREEVSLEIMQIVLRNGGDFAFPTTTIHLAQQEAEARRAEARQAEAPKSEV